jgi:cellulose synthase/poly-beta-1,6-N-acetylglucosamine synthase-like glycosyltransferase
MIQTLGMVILIIFSQRVGATGNQGSEPLVSVIISSYNRGLLLEEAIESIISQTYSNWELHVVDDGSDNPET